MAKKLDLVLGDRLVIMIQAQDGQIVGAGLRVKGFFMTPIDGIDKHTVYVGITGCRKSPAWARTSPR